MSKIIRSSEIGSYLYCRRAWKYQRSGFESENQPQMDAGTELHLQHGRQVLAAEILRVLAAILFLAALALLTAYCTAQIL